MQLLSLVHGNTRMTHAGGIAAEGAGGMDPQR